MRDGATRLGLSHHLPDEHFDGFIVEDVARFINKAVLSVRRIGVERHITHHAKLGICCFQSLDTAWN